MANTQLVERVETAAVVQAPASETAAIISMIERAARDPAVDMDKLVRLMEMRENIQARQALMDFEEAVSAAKSRIGPAHKNATGHNNKRYANFEAYAAEVDPVLFEFGLSYRFRTKQDGAKITVTCILSHRHGHREENSLESSPDKSGAKNDIQAIGSALTYLQRYTLIQALGLSATEDDDGKAAGAPDTISDDQLGELRLALVRVGGDIDANTRRFCDYFKVASLDVLPSKDFARALKAIKAKEGAKHD